MSKKILAALLAVLMVFSTVPMTALAAETTVQGGQVYGESGVAAAILHDTRTAENGAIADADLVKNYGITVTDGSDGVDKVVTLSGTDLRAHANAAGGQKIGYWIGLALEAPEGATHYKLAGSPNKDTALNADRWSDSVKAPVRGISSNVTAAGKSGFVQYFDLNDTRVAAAKKMYIKLQWYKSADAAMDNSVPVVYEFDYSAVKVAAPSIVAAGFEEIGTKALERLTADFQKAKGESATLADEGGCDKQTMWITMKDLAPSADAKNYKLVVKKDGQELGLKTGTAADKVGPGNQFNTGSGYMAIYWTFNQEATTDGTVTNAAAKSGAYTLNLCTADGTVIDTTSVTLGQLTVKASAEDPSPKTAFFEVGKAGKVSELLGAAVTDPTPAEGKVFEGWTTNGTTVITTEALNNVTPTGDVTYTAKFGDDYIVSAELGTKPDSAFVKEASVTATVNGTAITLEGAVATEGEYLLKYVTKAGTEIDTVVVAVDEDGKVTLKDSESFTVGGKNYTVSGTLTLANIDAGTPDVNLESVNATAVDKENLATALASVDADAMDDLVAAVAASDDLTAIQNMTEYKEAVEDGADVKIEVYLDVTAEEYSSTEQSLTLDITPKARIIDVDTSDTLVDNISLATHAVVTDGAPVSITIPLPAGFPTENVYVEHDGQYEPATISDGSVIITTTSFSKFRIFVDSRSVSVKFAGDADPTVLKFANVGSDMKDPAPSQTGKYFAGWTDVEDSTVVKFRNTLDEETFAALIAAAGGDTLNLYPVFTEIPADINHPNGPGQVDPNAPTVTIGVTQPENGTLSVEPKQAKAGEQVTVTVTPSEKYYVATSVTAKGDTTVTATKNANGTFTFTMPAGNTVTVTAEIKHIFDLFTDVPAGSFYADPVKWAVEQGITLGNSTDYSTFGTTASCTRKEMVLFLYRAAGEPAVTGSSNNFADITGSQYDAYRNAIQWAVDNGITQGTSETTFAPDDVCSRSQMVTFLYRYDQEPAVTGSNSFVDVPADAFYKTAVQWAVNKEVTQGTNAAGTTFEPYTACSRGQMVTFLYRYMGE